MVAVLQATRNNQHSYCACARAREHVCYCLLIDIRTALYNKSQNHCNRKNYCNLIWNYDVLESSRGETKKELSVFKWDGWKRGKKRLGIQSERLAHEYRLYCITLGGIVYMQQRNGGRIVYEAGTPYPDDNENPRLHVLLHYFCFLLVIRKAQLCYDHNLTGLCIIQSMVRWDQ